MTKPRILIVGQVPPPFHGQSIMQKIIVDAEFNWSEKQFINLDLSPTIQSVGKPNLRKLLRVIRIAKNLITKRLSGSIDLAYYPPASPNRIPFYRDIILLPILRIISKRIVFHFHSGGLDTLFNKLSYLEKKIATKIYSRPAAAIILLPSLLSDIEWIKPKKVFVVPNGIDLSSHQLLQHTKIYDILFTANIQKEKGIEILIDAIAYLNQKGVKLSLCVLGGWRNEEYEKEIKQKIITEGVHEQIFFKGIVTGTKKWEYYSSSKIFCLPTFYPTEAMPVTFLEAMAAGLPIVTTDWRANKEIVKNEINGFLVKPKNREDLAEKIASLLHNEEAMLSFSRNNLRDIKTYSLEKYVTTIEGIFKELLET